MKSALIYLLIFFIFEGCNTSQKADSTKVLHTTLLVTNQEGFGVVKAFSLQSVKNKR